VLWSKVVEGADPWLSPMLSVDGTLWVPDYSKPKVGVQGLDTSTGELAKDRVPGFSFPNQRLLGGDVFFADGSTFRPLPTAVFDTGGGRLWEAASYDQVTTPLATKEGRLLFAYTSRTSGGLHLDRFAGVAGATGVLLQMKTPVCGLSLQTDAVKKAQSYEQDRTTAV
jgi:hypothetical protein